MDSAANKIPEKVVVSHISNIDGAIQYFIDESSEYKSKAVSAVIAGDSKASGYAVLSRYLEEFVETLKESKSKV